MRIAYVINSVEGGGAARPVPMIARVLQDAGAEVRIFALTPRDRRGERAMAEAGLDLSVRDGGTTDHAAAIRWLRARLLEWGTTHIWTSLSRATILGLLLGPRLRMPVICWQHAAFLKPWNRRLIRLLQRRALLWIADSQSVAAFAADRLAISPDRLTCWPIYAADPSLPQAAPWQPGMELTIGSLGRLHPVKGYDVLIAALARLRDQGYVPPDPCRIHIGGEGAERGRLEALVRQAGLTNIGFDGFIDDPGAFLAGLHLYVQPSRSEGLCIAAHEALTAGVPVLASAVGELPYSIRAGETGLTVPAGDVAAWADGLRTLLDDPARLAVMGRRARADMLDRFSRERFDRTGTAIIDRIRRASA